MVIDPDHKLGMPMIFFFLEINQSCEQYQTLSMDTVKYLKFNGITLFSLQHACLRVGNSSTLAY